VKAILEDGNEHQIGKRMEERKDLQQLRKAWTLLQLESSVLPADGPGRDPGAWEALVNGVHARWTKEMNSSRTMVMARQYSSGKWHGAVPIISLSRSGYHDLGMIAGISAEDAQALHDNILEDARRSKTHGGAVSENPTTSVHLVAPDEPREPWMDREHVATVQGERELGALRRVREAVKAAVGKEEIGEMITEGLVARLGRGDKPSTTQYPRRHGDFIQKFDIPDGWSEGEKAEGAENSYTPPVLAVTVVLSRHGAVPTLFPCLETKFTQSMGLQPIGPALGDEEESWEYHERRFQRWELAWKGGLGDQVPMSSASGASSGRTDQGKTRAHPRRAGEPAGRE